MSTGTLLSTSSPPPRLPQRRRSAIQHGAGGETFILTSGQGQDDVEFPNSSHLSQRLFTFRDQDFDLGRYPQGDSNGASIGGWFCVQTTDMSAIISC
jgi:hypothetical protein